MKILYAIQGTGNGHLSRARHIIPFIRKKAEVDILISGTEADIDFPFQIKYRYKGLGFIFGKRGGVDLIRTYLKTDIKRFLTEVKEVPVEQYDLVINDFEPVSAWAARQKSVTCVALSHQSALLSPKAPMPQWNNPVGRMLLKHYAPFNYQVGFHFKAYSQNISTPVIREEVRNLIPKNKGHYTVYLPAYGDQWVIEHLRQFPEVRWEVFSKHCTYPYLVDNIVVFPVSNDAFLNSMAHCSGVLCGAGFETPAEAMFLGKKLMVIPMKNQYEQVCNAAALEALGVPVIKSLKGKYLRKINEWLNKGAGVTMPYPENVQGIVDWLISR